MAGPNPGGQERIERLLGLLAEQAHEHAIFLIDTEGYIFWWSHGAERVLLLPREQALGRPISTIFTPTDVEWGIASLEQRVAEADAISEDDRWHLRADGSRFWASGALIALRDEDGKVLAYGKILRDRTDVKEQVTLLQNQLSDAQQRSSAQELAITKIGHELRNVVAGLDAGMGMVRSATDERRREELLALMQQQLHVVRRLAEDVLDAKSAQVGKTILVLQPTVLQEVLRNAIEQASSRCQAKNQSLHLLVASGPILVAADRVRLFQVFANLIDNAIKYTPEGGCIWVKATIEDIEAIVHVEDNGSGIPAHMLTRIFEMFTQVDAQGSGSGLGIGLALVRELVHLHGGSVQATSKGVGLGSEFTVRLPLRSPQQLARPA